MSTPARAKHNSAFTIPNVAVEANQTLSLVRPGSSLPEEDAKMMMAALISTLGGRPHNQLQTVETVVNLFCLAVPNLAMSFTNVRTIKIKVVTMKVEEMRLWLHVEDPEEGKDRPETPALMQPPLDAALAVTDTAAVYAAVASVLFALGRQATESATAASLDKRPDALIRRFEISEVNQVLLPGKEAGPSREVLESIYNSFANYTELRSAVVAYFIGVKRASSHHALPMEVLMTNFQLMRGAGMTHVDAILRFARMHPWSLKVAELEPYWAKFAGELGKFQEVEEDVRMYHRLLVGQSDYLFISSEYRPLIAVAGDFIREVEQTFKGYVYNPGSYTDLIDKVRKYAPNYVHTSQLTNLANMLGVADVPLPTMREPVMTPESTVV